MSKSLHLATRSLEVGEQMTVHVHARRYWNDTGLELVKDAVYACYARGRWWDLIFQSGPDGYEAPWWSLLQRLLAGRRRVPTARWFALCGIVSGGGTDTFLIGSAARLQVPAGRMLCFANDVPGAYWNNFGTITLTIERLE